MTLTLSSYIGIGRSACRDEGGRRHICCLPKGRTGDCKDRCWWASISYGHALRYREIEGIHIVFVATKICLLLVVRCSENPVSSMPRRLAAGFGGEPYFECAEILIDILPFESQLASFRGVRSVGTHQTISSEAMMGRSCGRGL